jgi:hypothetical protein
MEQAADDRQRQQAHATGPEIEQLADGANLGTAEVGARPSGSPSSTSTQRAGVGILGAHGGAGGRVRTVSTVGETMYGFAVGVYPTDQPTLPGTGG